jgi:hypothetical protein
MTCTRTEVASHLTLLPLEQRLSLEAQRLHQLVVGLMMMHSWIENYLYPLLCQTLNRENEEKLHLERFAGAKIEEEHPEVQLGRLPAGFENFVGFPFGQLEEAVVVVVVVET